MRQGDTRRAERAGRGARGSVLAAAAVGMLAVPCAAGALDGPRDGASPAAVLPAVASGGGRAAAAAGDRGVATLASIPLVKRTPPPPALHFRLSTSLPLAVRKVRSVSSCSLLFARLGADGADRLTRTLYYPAPAEVVEGRCRKGALAATNPGSTVTWLCPAFASLPTGLAVMTLIHEALHFSGLPERPQAPDAMSSGEINKMVRDACGI